MPTAHFFLPQAPGHPTKPLPSSYGIFYVSVSKRSVTLSKDMSRVLIERVLEPPMGRLYSTVLPSVFPWVFAFCAIFLHRFRLFLSFPHKFIGFLFHSSKTYVLCIFPQFSTQLRTIPRRLTFSDCIFFLNSGFF